MSIRPWLKGLVSRISSDSRRRQLRRPVTKAASIGAHTNSPLQVTAEILETRTLLTSQVLLLGTELIVFTDADESVQIREDPMTPFQGQVLVDGQVATSVPVLDSTAITSIRIETGDENNTIDLSTLDSTVFTANPTISIVSGNGDDLITGSPDLAVSIDAGNGNDVITTFAAADTVLAGDGNDTVNAGMGDDSIDAGDGNDVVNGEDGNDTILGDDGQDTLTGNAGDDSISAGDGTDSVDGNDGNDTLSGDLGEDTIQGGLGDDYILGGGNNDNIDAGDGNDLILGNAGNDVILGGAGIDDINGGSKNDLIDGGTGSDVIDGGLGNDTINGNDDDDLLFGGGGNDSLNGQAGDDTQFGNKGDDTLIATFGNDSLNGGDGNDLLDNTFRPFITIESLSIPEGNAGELTTFSFNITLNTAFSNEVTVDFATADDTAQAPSDYVATSGTVVFAPGVTNQTIDIIVNGDADPESHEQFFVNLSNPTNAILNNTQATGIIGDDEATLIPPGLNITPTVDSATLTNAVVGTSSGIVVNGMTLSSNTLGPALSGGTFTAGMGAAYGLLTQGIVLSTGDVADYGDGPNTGDQTTSFFSPANAAQEALLDPITGGTFDHNDVTQLDISFDLMPGFDTLFFELVFGSEEFPTFVGGSFIDGFGIYLNGTNIAQVGGAPVNINHPDFAAVAGTELNGVLAPGGDPVITFSSMLSDGATGNTITFIIADTTDDALDSTVFLASLGATPPAPPLPPAPPAPAAPLVDTDTSSTMLGGNGQDTILGGEQNDFIVGDLGDDSIEGNGGADTIYGGGGNDTINGGGGEDFLVGNGGNDSVVGGDGEDELIWRGVGDGQETLIGGNGGDRVIINATNSGNTFTVGQSAEGLLQVTEGSATLTVDSDIKLVEINGNSGNDTVNIGDVSLVPVASLIINGGSGSDRIDASGSMTGALVITGRGGDGTDIMTGGPSGEIFFGGNGDDQIDGGGGNDSILGEAGADIIVGGLGNDTVDGGDGPDMITGDDGDDSLLGGAGNDMIDGSRGADTIRGGFGDDALIGSFGNDSVSGGVGRDFLAGGAGFDRLDGGRNDDSINGHGGNDTILGDHGNDLINGNSGDDEIIGGDGDDTISAGEGNDGVRAGDGEDFVIGDAGDDIILGGDGNDILYGTGGRDTILGEEGDDVVNGGSGGDSGFSGQGEDVQLVKIESELDSTFVLSQDLLDRLDGV